MRDGQALDEKDAALQALDMAREGICSRCRGPLGDLVHEEADPERQCWTQRDDALTVRLQGGYGCFHDIIDLHCVIVLNLCHDCNVQLLGFLGITSGDSGS